MRRILLISVRFHDGRYHGTGDWPPSPARLFQAIVAGIGQDGSLGDDASKPLEWLEELDPPIIAAPSMTFGMTIPMHFVPNNDLDAFGGSAINLAKTRTDFKVWKPKLFSQEATFHYAWQFDEIDGSRTHAGRICEYAERLYQLGRGIDQAWAIGEIIEIQKLEELLIAYRGIVYHPTGGRHGTTLASPQKGSLRSLKDRYESMSQRFAVQTQGRLAKLQFAQSPKPRFTATAYDSPPNRQVFEIRSQTTQSDLIAWPLHRISELVLTIRDRAVAKLKTALPGQESQVEKCLVGRKANGQDDAPKSARVRVLPLPSIGHVHADCAIRRVLIEVPPGCLLRSDDIFWSVSGLELDSANSQDCILTASPETSMLRHYGLGDQSFTRWRTITPAALPEIATRRRIEPSRRHAEAKAGQERAAEQQRAAIAVIQAIRHAEILAGVDSVRVQREPFEANGERVESFASGTRFSKESLWHVEIEFSQPLFGPISIGDGRYLGLGLMSPIKRQGEN
jgi:CRISPR-associated protein Csb2